MNNIQVDRRQKSLGMGSSSWFAARRAAIDSKPAIRRCDDLRRMLPLNTSRPRDPFIAIHWHFSIHKHGAAGGR